MGRHEASVAHLLYLALYLPYFSASGLHTSLSLSAVSPPHLSLDIMEAILAVHGATIHPFHHFTVVMET